MKKLLLLLMASPFIISGCIKDESPNTEADILEIILPEGTTKTKPTIENQTILALVYWKSLDLTNLAPEFEITSGAKIYPESGTPLDFTKPQVYTVVSEDGKWTKQYTIIITDTSVPFLFQFENKEVTVAGNYRYETPYELVGEPGSQTRMNIWATANPGFQLTIPFPANQGVTLFPTYMVEEGRGGSGYAARLETKKTGFLGGKSKPIAAGNLYLGSFTLADDPLNYPLKATKFGVPIDKLPVAFRGYYRYKSGDTFKDINQTVINQKDSCRIYAVLYDNEDGVSLNGYNVLTSDKLIATAILPAPEQTLGPDGSISSEYKYFEVDFEFLKRPDLEKLKESKYNFSVIFSSSYKGDDFAGAQGSVLYVDDIEVVSVGVEGMDEDDISRLKYKN